ncbi:ATP-binding protein [Acinetobacter baumannii]|uniref:ATP-binding protein n=1 Tax=Acinetobacter baumannii TaxID=470 RepID=UPI0039706A28
MNPVFKALQIHAEASDVCPIDQIPVMEIVGHKLCKLCAEETVHQSQVAYEAELQQRLLQQKIKNSGLNKRYLDCGFKNYVISRPEQDNAIKLCQAFVHQIISNLHPNLLLIGTPGTGKTHLSASVIRNILHHSRRCARYTTSADIAQRMMDTWTDISRSENEVINHFSSFDLLVIDEYGLHDRHEERLEMVHKILYSRYDSMKSTLLISNFTLQNMQQDLGVRLWSRLHENTLIVVPCYWDDHRITG